MTCWKCGCVLLNGEIEQCRNTGLNKVYCYSCFEKGRERLSKAVRDIGSINANNQQTEQGEQAPSQEYTGHDTPLE